MSAESLSDLGLDIQEKYADSEEYLSAERLPEQPMEEFLSTLRKIHACA